MVRRFDDDPELVVAAQSGDADAFTTLFRRWFDPCADVARRIVHDEETAAEVAQETFLVAWRQLGTLRDPSAFGGWVLRTTRNKALNRLERERHSVAVDQDEDPVLSQLEAVDDVHGEVAAADQQALVWAASAALGERDASVLDLHLRHGLDIPEIATALDITPNNAHQVVFRMKGKLAGAIRAWVLYKGGDPACPELARALRAADVTAFSAVAVKAIDRHVSTCEDCTRRQAAVLAPEAMFAAVPLLPMAGMLRERVVSSLRTEGVPLGPDAAVPANAPGGGQSGGSPQGSTATEAADLPTTAVEGGPAAAAPPTAAVVARPAPDGDDTEVAAARSGPRRLLVVALAVAVVALLVGGLLALRSDDDGTDVATIATDVDTTVRRSDTSVPTATSIPPAVLVPDPAPTTTRAPVTTPPVVPPPVLPPVTPPPVVGPQILTFTATSTGTCAAGGFSFTLVWSTADATSVSIAPSAPLTNGVPVTGGPQGTALGCALTPGSTWTLTATGPGGTATATD